MTTAGNLVTPISDEVKRFGAEIRRRRQGLDLSLADLATRVGLTSNFIGTIENGMRNPSISTVFSLARGLEAPPGELIAEAHGLGPPGLEVARLFNEMSLTVQERFIELLRLICIRHEVVAEAEPAAEMAELTAEGMEAPAGEEASAAEGNGVDVAEGAVEGDQVAEAAEMAEMAEAAEVAEMAEAAVDGGEGEAVEGDGMMVAMVTVDGDQGEVTEPEDGGPAPMPNEAPTLSSPT